ncbi:MAG: hypothetical protein ACR2H3_08145 [Acidimicrobiales bacterium]
MARAFRPPVKVADGPNILVQLGPGNLIGSRKMMTMLVPSSGPTPPAATPSGMRTSSPASTAAMFVAAIWHAVQVSVELRRVFSTEFERGRSGAWGYAAR